jgi:hypothetical protein
MRWRHTNPARCLQWWRKSFLLAALLLVPNGLKSQSPGPPGPRDSSRQAEAPTEMSAEEIFIRLASRILFLTCDESPGTSGLASGVLVSSDGFIVTNAHVVEGCRSMTATYIKGTERQSYEPALKYYDKKSDTAVLKIESRGLDFFPVLARVARVGERVYDIGNPRGLEQSISEGIVSGNREEDGLLWIQHSAPISPGSSGGALLSSRGELLGINSFLLKESQNLNFAVPATALGEALSAARSLTGVLKFPTAPPNATPSPADRSPQPTPPVTTFVAPSSDPVIQGARDAAATFTGTLPNYIVKQLTARYGTPNATGGKISWQGLDNVTSDLVEDGVEQYKNVLVNGLPAKEHEFHGRGRRLSSSQTGLWSEGEFSSLQMDVLSLVTNADFHGKRATMMVNRGAFRYDLSVEQANSHWHIEAEGQTYLPAYTGAIWIDEESHRVLRIEVSAKSIPTWFPLDQLETAVDYDYVFIGEGKYLLPAHSEALSCTRGSNRCRRNVIEFRNYGKVSGRN